MNEELTPLEALDELKGVLRTVDLEDIRFIDIIETALKRLESVDRVGEMFCINVDKKLKALAIIKEKVMPLTMLEDKTAYKENCYRVYDNEGYEYNDLTKEEYGLLKEVLI